MPDVHLGNTQRGAAHGATSPHELRIIEELLQLVIKEEVISKDTEL